MDWFENNVFELRSSFSYNVYFIYISMVRHLCIVRSHSKPYVLKKLSFTRLYRRFVRRFLGAFFYSRLIGKVDYRLMSLDTDPCVNTRTKSTRSHPTKQSHCWSYIIYSKVQTSHSYNPGQNCWENSVKLWTEKFTWKISLVFFSVNVPLPESML